MIGGELDRMAMAVLQPGFEGTEPPGWLRRALADGLGGVVLFARNVDRDGVRDGVRHGAADSTGEGASAGPANGDAVAGTAALVAELRRERPDVVVAVDEEEAPSPGWRPPPAAPGRATWHWASPETCR